MAILSTVLLISKNKRLYIENQHLKKKKEIKRLYIAKGGVLSGVEGTSCAQAA